MSEPFIGEIRILPYTYAPMDWVSCDGQLLPLAQYQALYAVIGTAFGGDGRNNFGVPNLKGRAVMGAGNGPNLTPRAYAATGGNAAVTLTNNQMPNHSHTLQATSTTQNSAVVQNGYLANPGGRSKIYGAYSQPDNVNLSATSVQANGGTTAHNNRQPYLVLQFCIATSGIYPVRQ